MMYLNHLDQKGNYYSINEKLKVRFSGNAEVLLKYVAKTFNFAYDMTFGHHGEHRDHRSGGTKHRNNYEIFADTFQGKLAEFALYQTLIQNKVEGVKAPDLTTEGLGIWDSSDLLINANETISVKSTKSFGNLLLLESKDWRYEIKNGVDVAIYIPNEKAYDYTFLVRIHPFCKDIIKEYRQDDLSSVDKVNLYNKLASYSWTFDIPGYIPNSDLARVIKYKYIIPRGARFGKATMDAQNYYVHAHDMYDLKSFIKNHTEPK